MVSTDGGIRVQLGRDDRAGDGEKLSLKGQSINGLAFVVWKDWMFGLIGARK